MSSIQGQTYQAGMEVRFARADRHSRRVRLLRIGIPIVVGVSMLVIVAASIFNPFRLLAQLPLSVGNLAVSGTQITMESPHLAGFTPDQRPYDLQAKTATQDITDPNHVDLHQLRAKVQMEDKSKDLSSKADVGARQISLSFEGKDVTRVAQVAIQADKATTLYISRVYLQRKNTSSIEVLTPVTPESGATYNLSGQPVHDGYQGIVVTKGKKVLKSSQ